MTKDNAGETNMHRLAMSAIKRVAACQKFLEKIQAAKLAHATTRYRTYYRDQGTFLEMLRKATKLVRGYQIAAGATYTANGGTFNLQATHDLDAQLKLAVKLLRETDLKVRPHMSPNATEEIADLANRPDDDRAGSGRTDDESTDSADEPSDSDDYTDSEEEDSDDERSSDDVESSADDSNESESDTAEDSDRTDDESTDSADEPSDSGDYTDSEEEDSDDAYTSDEDRFRQERRDREERDFEARLLADPEFAKMWQAYLQYLDDYEDGASGSKEHDDDAENSKKTPKNEAGESSDEFKPTK